MTKYNEIKILDGEDEIIKAKVITNTDEDTDLAGKNGVVTASVLYARDSSVIKPVHMDLITHEIIVMQHEHHEVHEGDHYFIKTWIEDTGGVANQTFFAFTTPDTPTRIHAKALLAPDVDFTVNIYEGSVITGGTPVVGINNDRDSVNTAGLTAVAALTHTTPGTVIWSARNGGGRNPVGVAPGLNYEIIAARNEVYVFELIKNVATDGIVDIDFFWYEHAPKS